MNTILKKCLALALVFFVFTKAQAVGVPPFDLSGTYTITKTDIELVAEQVVHLVAMNERGCRYIGKTQSSNKGAISILIKRKLCGRTLEQINVKPIVFKKALKAGDKFFIPVDGLAHQLTEYTEKSSKITK